MNELTEFNFDNAIRNPYAKELMQCTNIDKHELIDKLTELLNGVKDSYYDFVVGVLNYTKRNTKNAEDMISFIEAHPEADSSTILEYMISRPDYFDHAQKIVDVKPQISVQA